MTKRLGRAGVALAGCLAGLLTGEAARSQDVGVDRPVYFVGEPVTITYNASGGLGWGYRLDLIDLSGQPGKTVETGVLELEAGESWKVEPGSGTLTIDSALLRTEDGGRGWYEIALRDQGLDLLAHVPLLVLREWPRPSAPLTLLNFLGEPMKGPIGVGAPIVIPPPVDDAGPSGVEAQLWAVGGDRPAASARTAQTGEITLETRGLEPGAYWLRVFRRAGPPMILAESRIELEVRELPGRLKLDPPPEAPYRADALPNVDTDYGGDTLALFRLDEAGQRWPMGAWTDLGDGVHLDRTFGADDPVPAGQYELRLYSHAGSYLRDSVRFEVVRGTDGDPAPPPAAPQATLAIEGGSAVSTGATFTAVVAGAPGSEPVWLSLHSKSRRVAGCALREEAAIDRVLIGARGMERTYFRYPVVPAAGGVAELVAPWEPGAYELRLYGGTPPEYDLPDFPDAPVLARADLTVSWPAPPLTLTLTNGPTFRANDTPEVTVQLTGGERTLADLWEIRVGLFRASEIMPGGGISLAGLDGFRRVVEETLPLATAGAGSFDLRFAPLAVPPGPYEVRLTAIHPDRPQRRFLLRVPFDVTADYQPALPPEAAFQRADDGIAEGFWPQPLVTADCGEAMVDAATVPAPAPAGQPAEPAAVKPVLTFVEWDPGRFGDASDDVYRPVETLFRGYPYFLEARFPAPPDVATYSVTLANGPVLELAPTADATLYRSPRWFRIVGAEAGP